MRRAVPLSVLLVAGACTSSTSVTQDDGADPPEEDGADPGPDDTPADTEDVGQVGDTDTDADTDSVDTAVAADTAATPQADPFADRVVSFTPGDAAGFGQDRLPDVVLGPPHGSGGTAGSLDVLSLGRGGEIVLEFTHQWLVDGPGPDLLVFENPFSGFVEPGEVAVSEDGVSWHAFPCAADDVSGGFPGCAGVQPVMANPASGIDPTDPASAGGDAFDLADLGVLRARFVRIRDAQAPTTWYYAPSGGFDLDAVAVIHGARTP